MDIKSKLFIFAFCIVFAHVSCEKDCNKEPPVIVNGVRCFWKYTCVSSSNRRSNSDCILYVPKKVCENVQIHLREDDVKAIVDNSQSKEKRHAKDKKQSEKKDQNIGKEHNDKEQKTGKEITKELEHKEKEHIEETPPFPGFTKSVIGTPINCGPHEKPDPNGICKPVFPL